MQNAPYKLKLKPLQNAIQESYGKLARDPNEKFHLIKGRSLVARVGYAFEYLNRIPSQSIDAFAGVGNPFSIRPLTSGLTILDLGSGAGLDSCLAAIKVGPTGRVYGVDMTREMIETARESARKLRLGNLSYIRGYAEKLPLPSSSVDVVISNGAINLCPDKNKVYAEIFRVLKPSGRIQIADVVVDTEISPHTKEFIHLWVNCVAGGVKPEDYQMIVSAAGFTNIAVDRGVDVFQGAPIEEKAARYGARSNHIYAEKPGVSR